MARRNLVVLVNERGYDLYKDSGGLSTIGKIEAHRQGLIHRAVSVFIFNNENEILLQKRATGKYHSPDKWTNTCCTHPLPGESPVVAAGRRLIEEMGFVTTLTELFTFRYRANVGCGLIENEYDHIFIGFFDNSPNPNPDEVSDWKWVAAEYLQQELSSNPEEYSPWLRQCFAEVVKCRLQNTRTQK